MEKDARNDPPPEDGELGYTAPLEGGRTGLEGLFEPVPGQISVDDLLEARTEAKSLTRLQQLREERRG